MSGGYEWAGGSHVALDADVAGRRLEEIKDLHQGELTPEAVLNDARNPESPLHEAFEWRDNVAAEAHRLQQAGHLIRSLRVVVKMAEQAPPTPMRAFVNVTKHDRSSYTSLDEAMSRPDLRAQVVERAWNELLGWRNRHQSLQELARIFAAIDAEQARREKDKQRTSLTFRE